MLSVLNILSLSIFKKLSIVSGRKGLNKSITRTAILEWETPEDIVKTFNKRDFVITSFVSAKDNPDYMETCLRTLFNLQVGCIAIKDIYIKEISQEMQLLSDFHNVPVVIFSETYFDDIIFTIRKELYHNDLDCANTNILQNLLSQKNDISVVSALAKSLNPFFHNYGICCFSFFNENTKKFSLDDYYQQYLTTLNDLFVDSKEYILSIVKYKNGIFIILSFNDPSIAIDEIFLTLLKNLSCFKNGSKNGISTVYPIDHLHDLAKESLYAAISCTLDKESYKYFSQIGIDKILIPSVNSFEAEKFYTHYNSLLNEHDDVSKSNFLETLLTYIQCNCDINKTADILYQHKNTIRYRINKIKTIFNLPDTMNSSLQLYLFARLYLIHKYDSLLRISATSGH
jgi:Regulator of polyketide synthase expression